MPQRKIAPAVTRLSEVAENDAWSLLIVAEHVPVRVEDDWFITVWVEEVETVSVAEEELGNIENGAEKIEREAEELEEIERRNKYLDYWIMAWKMKRTWLMVQKKQNALEREHDALGRELMKQDDLVRALKQRIKDKERGGQGGMQEAKRERARHGDGESRQFAQQNSSSSKSKPDLCQFREKEILEWPDAHESRLVAQHNHVATPIQHENERVKIRMESLALERMDQDIKYLIRHEFGNHTMQYVFHFTPEPIVDILFDTFAEYAKHLRECKKNPRMQKAIRECKKNPPRDLRRIRCCAFRSRYGLWWMPMGKDAELIKYSMIMKCLDREDRQRQVGSSSLRWDPQIDPVRWEAMKAMPQYRQEQQGGSSGSSSWAKAKPEPKPKQWRKKQTGAYLHHEEDPFPQEEE